MTQEVLYSFVRKALTILGTVLVQRGWVGNDDMIELASGLAILIVSAYLSWKQTRQNEKTLAVGIAAQPGTPVSIVKEAAKTPATSALYGPMLLLALMPLLGGCAARSTPILVAQSTLGIAKTIGQMQESMITLQQTGVVDTRAALKVQEKLLAVNKRVEQIIPYLEFVDRLQKRGVEPTAAEMDGVITQVFLLMQDFNLIAVEVPVADVTKPFLDLFKSFQTTLTSTMIELARVRVAIER